MSYLYHQKLFESIHINSLAFTNRNVIDDLSVSYFPYLALGNLNDGAGSSS